jgi:recombination protein RecT
MDIVPSTSVTRYENYLKIKEYGQSPEVANSFIQLLGKKAPQYIQAALTAVQAKDDLMDCSPRSIFISALRAATLGLTCDPYLGHAYIVPYKNKKGKPEANFQPGWHGIQHMALRTGKYAYINVAPIYQGETVVEDRISGEITIEGSLAVTAIPIGLIASFKLLTGYKKSIFMTNEELEDHGRKYSKGYSKPDGIWQTNKKIAYHKTILLKLLRTYGYLDPNDAAILDEIEEGVETIDVDLPEENAVTIIDSKPLSTAEANKALGMDDVDNDFIVALKPDPMTEFLVETFAVDKPVDKPAEQKPKTNGDKWARPMSPETLKEALQRKAAKANPATEKQINLTRILFLEHFAEREDERHQAQEYLTGHKHFNEIEPEMISAILDWMKPEKATDGSGSYVLGKDAKIEMTMVARKFMEDQGQQTLAI